MPPTDLRPGVRAFLNDLDRKQQRLVTVLAIAYCNEVQRLMRDSPHSGAWYRRIRASGTRARLRGRMPNSGDYIYHQASAPGEPPAVDTGTLVNSVGYELGVGAKGFEALAGSSIGRGSSPASYPMALEFGRRDGSIAPRPAWRPALETIRQRTPEIAASIAAGGAGL